MKPVHIGLIALVIFGFGGTYAYQTMMLKGNDIAMDKEKMMENIKVTQATTADSMDNKMDTGEKMMDKTQTGARYIDYTKEAFDTAFGSKRVIFFHAKWCPTCKAANIAFTSNVSQIPEGVVIFKTDYDTESELKKKYGITYQHTFVQVDTSGNELAKWNGGDIKELILNLK